MALSHHTLIAWKRADDLFIKLHQLSLKAFPAIERFELGSQLRRSAFSVAVNIVEGFAQTAGPSAIEFLAHFAVVTGRSRLLHPRRAEAGLPPG